MRPTTRTKRLPANLACLLACLLIAVVMSSCGSAPSGPEPGPGELILPANPAGILLPGEPGDNAVSRIVRMEPSALERDDISDGLLTTRLDAWIAPTVTVAQVNEALLATGARIVSMRRGVPLVTLVVDAMADRDAAAIRAAAMQGWPAFLLVMTAREPKAEPVIMPQKSPGSRDKIMPETGMLPHLEDLHVAAAWNALLRAHAVNNPVPVLVMDSFSQLAPHPEIAALSFPADVKGKSAPDKNHGWHVAGILGADFEGDLPTGVHPAAVALMPMRGLPIGGLTWGEMLGELAHHFPASGKFVISTSLGRGVDKAYALANGGNWPVQEVVDDATLALAWRIQTAADWGRFLHATAAGNEGEYIGDMKDARIESPWTLAHFFADPRDAFAPGSLSPAQQAALDAMVALVQTIYPAASIAQPNVIVVGSSDLGGEPSTFSNQFAEIRTEGEDVVSTCLAPTDDCDGSFQFMSGTSMATPQVAALAAWLWNLAPDLSPPDVYDRLLRAYTASGDPGFTNAHMLTLSADPSATNAPVRRTLLDVAGSTPQPGTNGHFDEADVELFLTFFESYEIERQEAGVDSPDFSPYDLNGDNFTGGGFLAPVDLTVDGLPQFGNATFTVGGTSVTADETAVTDLDCLCYEAYSPLFDGDDAARDALLLEKCGGSFTGIVVTINGLPNRIEPDAPTPVTILAGLETPNGVVYMEGIDVHINAFNGDVADGSGVTDANGMYATTVTLDNYRNELFLKVKATYQQAAGAATASVLRPNKIEFSIRETTVSAEVIAGYCPEINQSCPRDIYSWNEVYDTATGPVDESFTRTGSATMAGMSVHGDAAVSGQSMLTLNGDEFQGVTLHANMDASITLSNPNSSILSYYARAGSWVSMYVAFTVWGDPASFNLAGSVSTMFYDIELDGEEVVAWCNDTDAPCSTVSSGGLLPPGEYDFDVYAESSGWIHWQADNCQDCVTSGTEGGDGLIDLTLTVSQ